MYKIGFIGAGNMGYPEIKGAAALLGAGQVTFFEANEERRALVAKELSVTPSASNQELIANSEYVVLVVKPQVAPLVYPELKKALRRDSKIITSMAGISTETILKELPFPVPVIRWMPNTPAMVGEGMTSMSLNGVSADSEEARFAKSLCESFGRCVILPEALMSAACCANGSSPAYVYMMIEALADSVVKYGIPRATAYELVAQTVLGSAKMVLESGRHPGELKDNVCSPGGTTIAAVEALEASGFRNALFQATDACFKRSEELS